jgi:replication factor A1
MYEKIAELYPKIRERVSKEDFLKKYEEIREHFGDTINQETALLLAAYNFGYLPRMRISDLKNAKGEVSVSGRVLEASLKEFKKKEGIFARLRITDGSDEVTALLWNDAAELVRVGDVFPGCEVELRGFVRRNGEIEISVSDASNVEILESREVEVEGLFLGLKPVLEGKIMILASDKIETFFFKRGFEKLKGIKFGDYVRLKFHSSDIVELEISEKKFDTDIFTPISNLKDLESGRVSLKGRITGIGMLRKIVREDREIRYAEIHVSDNSGRVRVLLWDENTSLFRYVDVGKTILILNARFKDGEVHCGNETIVLIEELESDYGDHPDYG